MGRSQILSTPRVRVGASVSTIAAAASQRSAHPQAQRLTAPSTNARALGVVLGLRSVQLLSCGAHLPLGAALAVVRKVFRAAFEADSTNA